MPAVPKPRWRLRLTEKPAFSSEFSSEFAITSTTLFHATADSSWDAARAYERRIVQRLALTRRQSDPIYRSIEAQTATVELANADGALAAAFATDLRGDALAV